MNTIAGSCVVLVFNNVAASAALEVLNCNATLCEAPSPVITQFKLTGCKTPAAVVVSVVSTRIPALAVEHAALSVMARLAAATPVAVPIAPLKEIPSFQPVGIVTVRHRFVLSATV